MKYLIWSNQHNKWWGANHSGYTSFVERAGRYDLNEAIKICNAANYGWDTHTKKIPYELPITEEAALKLKYKIEGGQ